MAAKELVMREHMGAGFLLHKRLIFAPKQLFDFRQGLRNLGNRVCSLANGTRINNGCTGEAIESRGKCDQSFLE